MKTTPITRLASLVLIALVAVNFFGGCEKKDASGKLQKITLRQAWFPWCGYAGEVAATGAIASSYGVDLTVEKGADDIDPIKLVLAGNNDFGVASAETVVDACLKGADLVIIGVINYKTPTCFIALEEQGVHSFQDFKGKKVGILTATETETAYKLLKLKGIIDASSVTEIEVPFDIASFVTTKSYDIRPAYVYDEPISLDAKGVKYTMLKADAHVSLISGVYFTRGKTLRESPDKVRAFVFAMADGWTSALAHPEEAIRLLSAYDKGVDAKKELQSLKVGLDYFSGENGRVLWASPERLKGFAEALVSLKKTANTSDILKWIDLRFVDEYAAKKGAKK